MMRILKQFCMMTEEWRHTQIVSFMYGLKMQGKALLTPTFSHDRITEIIQLEQQKETKYEKMRAV